ncbi:hypothetical protein BDR22DRAFT_822922 [Usnea florida]
MPRTFTTLPLEVRNEIYAFVFDHDRLTPRDGSPGRLCKSFEYAQGQNAGGEDLLPQQNLALLSVSQQISHEAAAYFYGKTIFRGTWYVIAPFINGIGVQRRNMIRTIELFWRQSLFEGDESPDMLAELTSLRTVHIYGLSTDFTHLQDNLIPECVSGLVGKVDINISVNVYGNCLSDSIPPVLQMYVDEYTWSCARNTAQWTGGEPIRCTFL